MLELGPDLTTHRQFVASFVIRSLEEAPGYGCLRQALNTLEGVIRDYVIGRADATEPGLLEAYRTAVVYTLERIKEYHRADVLHLLDRLDIDREELRFLAPVKSAVVEKKKLFEKSYYGHRVYQACFSESERVRAAFAEATRVAADASSVEAFFGVYTDRASSCLRDMEDSPPDGLPAG